MTQLDMGIAYNAKLKEVKENIKKLKKLNFNMGDIEDSVMKIENKIEESIKDNYDNFDKENTKSFLYDTLNANYNNAIEKLSRISNLLVNMKLTIK